MTASTSATAPKSAPTSAPTPMMAQYLDARAQARDLAADALLFYRMGDFYELFFDDAVAASAALDIALTKRGQHEGADIPMCGVPVHAMDSYLARLIRAGFKVCVAEQMEDPATARKRGAKSVVRREIVRLVTPGTLTEDALLTGSQSNHLAAVAQAGGTWAVAWVDMSTGHMHVQSADDATWPNVVARVGPSELLATASLAATIVPQLPPQLCLTHVAADTADSTAARALLEAMPGRLTADAIAAMSRAELSALGQLLRYCQATQRGLAVRLLAPQQILPDAVMAIDAASLASLELVRALGGNPKRCLLGVINHTVTAPGARLLAARLVAPLTCPQAIGARLDLVAALVADGIANASLRQLLRQTPDMERALQRLALGRASPRDLAAIRSGLGLAHDVAAALDQLAAGSLAPAPAVLALRQCFQAHGAEHEQLVRALVAEPPAALSDGNFIAPGFDATLDHFRSLVSDARRHIAQLEDSYRRETGIAGIKIRHNNVIGYHLEVSARTADALLANPAFIHRQTMAGAVRFSTVALNDLAAKISSAGAQAQALELEHFEALRQVILARGPAIATTAQALAQTDVAAGLADKARADSWVRPVIDASTAFDIVDGRHPVVEAALADQRQPFVANSCNLGAAQPQWLVTGPNMAGKSTYLRQNALIAVLAQMGSFVPAASAHIGVVTRLFSRVGASDDLAQGRSTFMVEMVETAAILNQADARALVILDEVGRGTATYDGLAIAWATLEHLHDVNQCRTLFATHYHELAALKARLAHLALYTVAVKAVDDQLLFLHQIVPGTADRSYGLNVARMAGIPAAVAARASEVLGLLEAGTSSRPNMLGDLPLFQPRAAPAALARDNLRATLTALRPDELTPRAALDALYALKSLL